MTNPLSQVSQTPRPENGERQQQQSNAVGSRQPGVDTAIGTQQGGQSQDRSGGQQTQSQQQAGQQQQHADHDQGSATRQQRPRRQPGAEPDDSANHTNDDDL